MKIRPSVLLASISALVASAASVHAVDFNWTNAGTGDWETAANWNTGTVPGGGGGNFVYVNNGGTVNINANTNSIQDPFVGRGAGAVGTVNQLAGNHNNVGWTFIGDNGGTGAWNVLGNSSLSTGRIYLGGTRDTALGGNGSMTINTTGTVNASSDFSVGTRGATGTLNVQAGTVNAASWMIIGETHGGASATGVVNQTGGVVSNGTGDANGRFWMGSQENGTAVASNATYNISGGTLNARNVAIGRHYGGTINQTGGTVNFTSGEEATNLGQFGGSTGTYNISAGALNTNGTFNVGDGGTGILNASGTGVANVTGANGLRMGSNGGSGTLNLNGGTVSAPFIQKLTGSAQINANGGTLQARAASSDYFVGFTAANIDVQAGGLKFDTNNNAVTITQNLAGAGGLTKAGNGTLSITGVPTYSGATSVTGGTLSAGNGGTTGALPGTVNVGAAGTFAINRSDDMTNTTAVTGAGSFAQNGPNTLTIGSELGGLTGTVNVNAGKLVNSAAGNIAGAALSVNSGGRLLPLGNAVGAINTTGFTAGLGSTIDIDFSAGGATFDQIVSSGGLTFGASFTLNLFQVGTSNPFSNNGTYSLFDYVTSVTGSTSGFTVGNPIAGKSYQLANNVGDTTVRLSIADAVLVQWNQSGGGLWSTNTNWTPNITPNVATADVNFTSSITAASTVDLNGNKTSGKLTFDNANSYTIGGAGTLTLDNGLAASSITVLNGSHFINTPMVLAGSTGISTAAGTMLQLADVSGAVPLTKTGNGTLVLNGATASSGGMVVTGGLVQVGTGGAGGALPTGNISLSGGTRISYNSTSNATIAGNITGGGSFSQDAAGTVTHTGTSTYSGFTDLNAGTFINSGSIVGTSNIDVDNTTTLSAGSTTTTPGVLNVGANGTGTLNVNGGTVSNFETYIGGNGGSSGAMNMSAGRMDTNHWSVVGLNGGSTGVVTQTGGTWNQNHTDWLSIGQGGTGTYTMSGSSVLNDQSVVDTSGRGTNKGNVVVGRSGGTGTWTLNDNAAARVRDLVVGDAGGSTGTVNINGTSSITSSYDPHIGINGTGVVNINGGSLTTVSGWVQIGINGGSSGTLNMTAGSMYAREFRVGESGTGVVDVSGGVLTANQNTTMGINATGNGTFIVRGTGRADVQNGGMNVGGTGEGALLVADSGILNINGTLTVGNGGTKIGHAYVSGGTTSVNGELWVGQAAGGSGTMDISAGTVTANNWIAIGRQGATGVVNLGGTGSLIKTGANTNHVVIGSIAGVGTLNQTGGTFTTAGSGEVRLGESAGGQGTWTISGGTASTDAVSVGWAGAGSGNFNITDTALVNIGAGGLRIGEGGNGTVAQLGGTINIAGVLDAQGGGTGLFALAGGRLNIDGGADLTTGAFNFGAGKLSRSNPGVISIAGPLSTADAAATLKLDADKTFTISGAFDNTAGLTLEVPGLGIPDGTYSGSPITGMFSLGNIGGLITLQGNAPGGNAFDIGHTSLLGFDAVFNLGGGSLTANRINEDAPFNASSDSVYWIDEDAGVVTVQYNVVPEPSSVALMIGGLVVLARRRRRE